MSVTCQTPDIGPPTNISVICTQPTRSKVVVIWRFTSKVKCGLVVLNRDYKLSPECVQTSRGG